MRANYRVFTIRLAADAARADPAVESIDLGKLPADELVRLLERFRALDAAAVRAIDPGLELRGRAGRFRVRTNGGRLLLYSLRDALGPYEELEPAAILSRLDGAAGPAGKARPSLRARWPSLRRFLARRLLPWALIVAALGLLGDALRFLLALDSVRPPLAVAPLASPAQTTARLAELAGTYATGDQASDRTIVLEADGRVRFSELGRPGGAGDITGTCFPGRHANRACLATADGDLIEIADLDTLIFCDDTYRRRRG